MVFARSVIGLQRITLFNQLPLSRLEVLAQQCTWQHLPAGVSLVIRSEERSNVYFLVSGRLRIMIYAANGRQVTFRDCEGGEHFGEMAAIDGHARSADVVTLKQSLVASMDGPTFRQLLGEEPLVAQRVMIGLSSLVRQLTERLVDLSSTHVMQRANLELLRIAQTLGHTSGRVTIQNAPTHSEIAAMISTTREEVTRAFSALAAIGLLESRGRTLTLHDLDELRRRTQIDVTTSKQHV